MTSAWPYSSDDEGDACSPPPILHAPVSPLQPLPPPPTTLPGTLAGHKRPREENDSAPSPRSMLPASVSEPPLLPPISPPPSQPEPASLHPSPATSTPSRQKYSPVHPSTLTARPHATQSVLNGTHMKWPLAFSSFIRTLVSFETAPHFSSPRQFSNPRSAVIASSDDTISLNHLVGLGHIHETRNTLIQPFEPSHELTNTLSRPAVSDSEDDDGDRYRESANDSVASDDHHDNEQCDSDSNNDNLEQMRANPRTSGGSRRPAPIQIERESPKPTQRVLSKRTSTNKTFRVDSFSPTSPPRRDDTVVQRDPKIRVDHTLYTQRPPHPWDDVDVAVSTSKPKVGWHHKLHWVLVHLVIQHGRDYEKIRREMRRLTGYFFHIDHITERIVSVLQQWERKDIPLPPAMNADGTTPHYTIKGLSKSGIAKAKEKAANTGIPSVDQQKENEIRANALLLSQDIVVELRWRGVVKRVPINIMPLTRCAFADYDSSRPNTVTLPLLQATWNAFIAEPTLRLALLAMQAATYTDVLLNMGMLPPTPPIERSRWKQTVEEFPFHPDLIRFDVEDQPYGKTSLAKLRNGVPVMIIAEELAVLVEEKMNSDGAFERLIAAAAENGFDEAVELVMPAGNGSKKRIIEDDDVNESSSMSPMSTPRLKIRSPSNAAAKAKSVSVSSSSQARPPQSQSHAQQPSRTASSDRIPKKTPLAQQQQRVKPAQQAWTQSQSQYPHRPAMSSYYPPPPPPPPSANVPAVFSLLTSSRPTLPAVKREPPSAEIP